LGPQGKRRSNIPLIVEPTVSVPTRPKAGAQRGGGARGRAAASSTVQAPNRTPDRDRDKDRRTRARL